MSAGQREWFQNKIRGGSCTESVFRHLHVDTHAYVGRKRGLCCVGVRLSRRVS